MASGSHLFCLTWRGPPEVSPLPDDPSAGPERIDVQSLFASPTISKRKTDFKIKRDIFQVL
jgi:hypothetical protein